MAKGTRWKVTYDKLAQHDEVLVDLLASQKENNRGGLLPIPNQDNMNRPQQAPILPPRVGDEQIVEIVALYLNGAAEVWYRSVILSGGIRNWIEFKEELVNKFGPNAYQKPNVDEAHFLSSFIGALKKEIKFYVKMFKPTTLKIDIEKARMQEMAIETALKRNMYNVNSHQPLASAGANKGPTNYVVRNNTFRISPEVYEYRKINHLCFRERLNLLVDTSEVTEEPSDLVIEGGNVKKRQLSILIYSKGTHSFIDEHIVIATTYQSSHCPPMRMIVADGNYMKKHNPTKFDHEKKCGTIGRKNNKLVLPGLVEEVPSGNENVIDVGIQEVVDQNVIVFAEPQSLPLVRALDHPIPLKSGAMPWNPEAELALEALKIAMPSTPVLVLPDYTQEFLLGTNVLASKQRGISTYEKEYMALLSVVDKWRHYLQFKHFIVRTDHYSLKCLLEQKVTSTIQQKGLTKLLGLDYEVKYKKGAKNRVANELSRKQESLGHLEDQA
ncbi:hypothetical protein KY290_007687 [Solanum tuberosum]|uniref:Reverse transcriptase RNase H-like domain-containing protein n=1 Tax=Solanum tuberosum TaxID=4113 RepID=A0ABQ7W698_SOLTU|nr:hypothetical protein KY290_007687 [Solanum tuberosum]